MSYFNKDQEAHMEYLATVPRGQRCASGWHVVANEKCDCGIYRPCMKSGCLKQRDERSKMYCYDHMRKQNLR